MERRQRLVLLAAAAAIAVIAIVVALVSGGGDDNNDKTTSSTAAQGSTAATPAAPQGTTETIDIKGGQPDGGVKKVDATKDQPLQITVNSDQKVPIHFHGYDIEKP